MTAEARTIRYVLGAGERFGIDAVTRERIIVGAEPMMDVEVSFVLASRVVAVDGDLVELEGRFDSPKITGTAPAGALPEVAVLHGTSIRVWKGLDGRVERTEGAGTVEALFGGLTAPNALRWFAARFPTDPVAPGDRWEQRDRWLLRADRTPLQVQLPVYPEVEVRYGYRLRGWTGDGRGATIDVEVAFSGGAVSDELGLELEVGGEGRGEVLVDLEEGKLERSTKTATLRITPQALRRGALALPPLSVERRSEAGFRPGSVPEQPTATDAGEAS